MKKVFSTTLVLAAIIVLCLNFTACVDSQNVDGLTKVKYETVLADYLKAPDGVNLQKMQEVERNVKDIFADSSLTDAQKVAQMIERSTQNEIVCDHFAYFNNKSGSSKIGSNSGTLIYQRLRRQSDALKDDTTLKLPVNHNFGSVEVNFVTDATIRYVNGGKYNRIEAKSNGDISYDTKTGLLTVANWKKGSKWDQDEKATDSRSYDEARKTTINWNAKDIVSSDGVKILEKTDSAGNKYYELTFSIDVAAANADKTSINRLQQDNGGKGMKYIYCDMVVEIWECGLAKRYQIKDSWSGRIAIYNGSAKSESEIVFSYSDADMDNSKTDAIYKSIK